MSDPKVRDEQQQHWQRTFAANPDMYGAQPSDPGRYAIDLFKRERKVDILELGAGQGRDTIAFLAAGFSVTAIDYESESLRTLHDKAESLEIADRLSTICHDVRDPLPMGDVTFDAVYSHMLFNMALTTDELDRLTAEVR